MAKFGRIMATLRTENQSFSIPSSIMLHISTERELSIEEKYCRLPVTRVMRDYPLLNHRSILTI